MRKAFAVLLVAAALLILGAADFPEIIIEIDYVRETIRLSGKDCGSAVKYMYSPNVSAAAEANLRRQAGELWFPLYGDELDISGFIPGGRNSSFIFAFRDADEIAGPSGVFSSRTATTVIRGRPLISNADFRARIIYNPRYERIEIDPEFGPFDFQVGSGAWVLNNNAAYIDASARFNPQGSIFTIRASAVPGRSFASNEFRLRVPRAPAAPNVRLNERTGRLTGVRVSMQWAPSPDGPWISFRDRSGSLDIFRGQTRRFAVRRDEGGGESIAVYIRVAATDRAPSSPPQRLLIDAAFLD